MEEPLLCGYGDEIITPGLPCSLAGYGYYRGRQADSVLDDIKVRTVFLQDAAGNRALLSSADLIGFSVQFSDMLRNTLSGKFGIPFNNIFIFCTHTHSGPASMLMKGLGEPDSAYMAFLEEKIITAAGSAVSRAEKKDAKWNVREIEPVSFNRATGKTEPLDNNLGAIILTGRKEKIYLLNYACHPVVLGINNQVSADFPGRVCRTIEQTGHKCIYFQGFAGNVNPFIIKLVGGRGSVEHIDFYGRHIAENALFLEKDAMPFAESEISGDERRVAIPYIETDIAFLESEYKQLSASHNRPDGYQKFLDEWLSRAKEKLAKQGETGSLENVPVNMLNIGSLNFMGLPGEAYCEVGLKIRNHCKPVFPVGNNNGNIGYIPTGESYGNLKEYACYQAPKFYGTFPFSRKVESIFMESVTELLGEK